MRNFIYAGSIAAALHGVLLGIPRGAAPGHRPIAIAQTEPAPPAIAMVEARNPVDDVVTTSASGAPDPTPRRVDAPQFAGADLFKVPVEVSQSGPVVPDVVTIGVMGLGPGIGIGTDIGPVSLAKLDHTPRPTLQIAPDYPLDARRESRTGAVTVEFVVDETGRVVAPHIVETSDRVFNEAALRAVRQWRFEPGTVGGELVRFRMAVPVVFHLDT